jgi:hypothetical protein
LYSPPHIAQHPNRLTITGDDNGLRGEPSQSSAAIVARYRLAKEQDNVTEGSSVNSLNAFDGTQNSEKEA